MNNKYIELRNLTKVYHSKSNDYCKALNNINLSLPSSGMVFLVGRSGSGKTTLLNMLGGIDNPTKGEIWHGNRDVAKLNKNALDDYRCLQVGFIFQEYHLLSGISVYDNIVLATDLIGIAPKEEEIDALLDQLDIKDQKHKKINELSGGQKQRVAIARSLIKKPSFLLADEPTGALDYATGMALITTLKEISKEKLVVVVSHDETLASKFADRIIKLSDGRIFSDKVITQRKKVLSTEEANPRRPKIKTTKLWKMSLRGMLEKKIRLAFLLITTLLLLVAFGFVVTFTNYDRNRTFLEEMYRTGNYFLPLTKEEGINQEKLDKIQSILGPYELASSANFGTNSIYAAYFLDRLFPQYSEHIMDLNKDDFERLNLTVLYGKLPSSDNEIMISSDAYNYLVEQVVHTVGNETVIFSSFFDITNYVFKNDKVLKALGEFRISGVFEYHDSPLNTKKIYTPPFNIKLDAIENFKISSLAIVNKGFVERYLADFNMDNWSPTELVFGMDVPKLFNGMNASIRSSFGVYGKTPAYKLYKEDRPYDAILPGKLITENSSSITELKENEAIIPITFLKKLYNKNNVSALSMLNDYVDNAIIDYVTEAYPKIKDAFLADYPDGSLDKYVEYIYNVSENEYDLGYNYTYFDNKGLEYLASCFFAGEFYPFDISKGVIVPSGEYSKRIEIKGFYFIEYDPKYIFYDTVFLSDELYQELKGEFLEFDCREYYITLSGNLADDLALLESMNDLVSDDENKAITELSWGNYLLLNIVYYEGRIKEIVQIATYLMLVLAAITFFLIYSYFHAVIVADVKKIGILRGLGMKRVNVFEMYLVRSMFLALILIIPSVGLTNALISYINNSLISVGDTYAFAFFGIHTILAIIILDIIAMVAASTIPIYKIAKLSPAEAIKAVR